MPLNPTEKAKTAILAKMAELLGSPDLSNGLLYIHGL